MIAERALKTLEYDKVRQQVATHCTSSIGKSAIEELVPQTDFDKVVQLLEEMDEGLSILRVKGNVPMGGIFDVRPSARRAQIGGMLAAIELMEISSTIRASRILRNFIEDLEADEVIEIPHFIAKKETMPVLTGLQHEINNCIDDNGAVLDSASSTLRTIRQSLRSEEAKVRSKLESLIRGSNASKMLSDTLVTIRNDRFVIPVKQEYRHHYGGIVHDQSSSGQTLFIEPDSIVQANNEIHRLKMKEQAEVERILLALSAMVQDVAPDLFNLVKVLGDIDVILAKGKYGQANKCTMPKMNQDGYIRLVRARHPLLPIDTAVPNDIEFGKDITAIVITGPNTGGKTVTLKTVGLCTLMAQAGLPVPALDGSQLAVFKQLFADIGDEQSIEQSLSTFSSHMVNIVDILQKFDDESLVLFDELGAGTDPQEGAALAISILDEVHGRGARVMATTHYPELKAYGYNRPGVANASVEFDIETLSPTYRLLIGVPGRSNAFEISSRLGLPETIIERAKGFTGTDRHEVESMIASLEETRRQSEDDAERSHALLLESESLRKELQDKLQAYDERKEALDKKAKEKARKIVEEAKHEAEGIIAELREMRKNADQVVKEHELIEARKRLEEATPLENNKVLKKAAQVKARAQNLVVGDEVKVLSYGQRGTLLEKVSNTEWVVQMGILKMKISDSDLEYIKPEKEPIVRTAGVKNRNGHVKLELDLRGERYEDAILRTEKYIDDALLANYGRVSIIHGVGTGALRQGIQSYLKNNKRVKSFRFGEAGEGGLGVTVVELK
ncbi:MULTISPECIES: endonuclease MutS2 [Lysinibacillus]|uniref:endonuclease MutS2 n=1 Tax=Lysinibacillus TaxID=400634 RepID=UPI0004D3F9F2|nr:MULTISPECIES: endonuclease MutS2 [Lysinibacillus]MDC6268087.1 endonuclease MutS2 [Lysinibacillus sphaericus]AJK86871.1 recombination and DNA strand exchange inhibitor protein [Lysinibacillus fusiformis]KGA81466.1 recombination and DNA strand exchange inhibitor protein [Lysinibacillus fusiformis]KHK56926.1 recombination and DNA strand exchange inhibitor protein [Lysinibacillus sp. A1]MCE4044837.1 endonuclease MutS2 [Lysinibacillus fusiformis]